MRIAAAATGASDAAAPSAGLARELRRADDFIVNGALAIEALLAAGNEAEKLIADDCGLYLGTAFGPMNTNLEVSDQLFAGQPVSPVLFSQSLFNAAAGHLARIFGLHGAAMTITDFGFPFFQALHHAYAAIASGLVRNCLVLQVEDPSPLLDDAARKLAAAEDTIFISHRAGAAALLLAGGEETAGRTLESLRLTLRCAPPGNHLRPSEVMTVNRKVCSAARPLANTRRLVEAITSFEMSHLDIVIDAPYGSCSLRTGPWRKKR